MKYSEEFSEFYREKFPREKMNSNNTLIILDTNALLNVFRFTPKVAELYFKTIKNNSSYLYIPYLVALEFHFNKKVTLFSSDTRVSDAKNNIEKRWKNLGKDFSKDIFKDFSFTNGEGASKDLENEIASLIDSAINGENGTIKAESLKLIDSVKDVQGKLFDELISIIENKTGERYTQDWIDITEKEGEERYKNDVPPGFNDKSKHGYREFNKIKYQLKFGDLIIWKDILRRSEDSSIEYVVFVTSDGKADKKSDLLFKVSGNIIGPRIELLHEMKSKTDTNFYIIDELEFLRKFSEEKPSSSISYEMSETLANITKAFSSINLPKVTQEKLQKVASSLGNLKLNATLRKNVQDVSDLEKKIVESYEISNVLADFLGSELPNTNVENYYGDTGWREFESLDIIEAEIEEYTFEDEFYEVKCAVFINARVDYNIVVPNPDFEPEEAEYFYESRTSRFDFTVSFSYDLDYDLFDDIEIIDFEILS